MLYLAQFADQNDVLVGARDAAHALERLAVETDEKPTCLRECPDDVMMAEVRWADADDAEQDPENPANAASSGVVLEPFEELGEFLEQAAG